MIAIIDYKAGNITSVRLGCEAVGAVAEITSDPAVIRAASHVIFPGVGAAGYAMDKLRESELIPVINECLAADKPFLGICLGTQILFEHSEEDGGVPTLGIFSGKVKKFIPQTRADKIPHMGWNQAKQRYAHPLLAGVPDNADFYFVHSYYTEPALESDIVCTTNYCGIEFTSMVGRGKVAATQFHIEKSGKYGLQILKNFANL